MNIHPLLNPLYRLPQASGRFGSKPHSPRMVSDIETPLQLHNAITFSTRTETELANLDEVTGVILYNGRRHLTEVDALRNNSDFIAQHPNVTFFALDIHNNPWLRDARFPVRLEHNERPKLMIFRTREPVAATSLMPPEQLSAWLNQNFPSLKPLPKVLSPEAAAEAERLRKNREIMARPKTTEPQPSLLDFELLKRFISAKHNNVPIKPKHLEIDPAYSYIYPSRKYPPLKPSGVTSLLPPSVTGGGPGMMKNIAAAKPTGKKTGELTDELLKALRESIAKQYTTTTYPSSQSPASDPITFDRN